MSASEPLPALPALRLGRYRHYKGGMYEVLGVSRHSETLEPMVVYRPLYDTPDIPEGTLWVRPAAMFGEMVSVGDGELPRFSFLGKME